MRAPISRPGTCCITKNGVPMTPASSHRPSIAGTGTPLPASADITRNSRSTACALGSSWPGGFLRSTHSPTLVARW
jgi:hypothetical protein